MPVTNRLGPAVSRAAVRGPTVAAGVALITLAAGCGSSPRRSTPSVAPPTRTEPARSVPERLPALPVHVGHQRRGEVGHVGTHGRVPASVEHLIAQRHPTLGFVPTFAPSGYHYQRWRDRAQGFDITFRRGFPGLAFAVSRESCSALGSPMRVYSVARVQVNWSATYEDQQAWRCLRRRGTNIVIVAARSIPGDDALDTRARRRRARELTRVVASARLAR
jgi:hypothetical protein